MSQRLTRKEIKHDIREDEVQHVLHRVLDFLVHRPKLIKPTTAPAIVPSVAASRRSSASGALSGLCSSTP